MSTKKFSSMSNEALVERANTRFKNGQNDDDEVHELFERAKKQGWLLVPGMDDYKIVTDWIFCYSTDIEICYKRDTGERIRTAYNANTLDRWDVWLEMAPMSFIGIESNVSKFKGQRLVQNMIRMDREAYAEWIITAIQKEAEKKQELVNEVKA